MNSEQAARAVLRERIGADAAAMERLDHLVTLLREENQRQNLVSRSSLEAIWHRHLLDSAQLLAVPRETVPDGVWLDLGTGAGFPGLVIAALQPDRPMLLVDSRRLRTDWLARASAALQLTNVDIVQSRVEDLPQMSVSVISARAFAPLQKLLAISSRFSTPQTLWLLPKGASAPHELQMLSSIWSHTFHVEHSLTDPAAGIIAGRLLSASPARINRSSRQ